MNILLRIHIDGVSRGNPGASGIGVTIHRENKLILIYGEYVGILDNIQSEYIALKRALELAIKFDNHIMVFSDCLQVVKQRRSKNKLRRKDLRTLARQIVNLENKFDIISYMFVPRKRNIHVDKVANKAVNNYFNTHYTI